MLDLNNYLHALILNCQSAFDARLLYVGLQGSYLRGEAHENSDIDVMVILEDFRVQDMISYREILKKLGFYEKSCGFICGKEELRRWNPLEVCQLRHTTKDLFGVLTDYLPTATREDEVNYVKLSLGNLYHELCHRFIHADREKNAARFRGTCKGLFYLIQNLHFLESGCFILSKQALQEAVAPEDRRILELAGLPDNFDFEQAFSALFQWCQRAFARISAVEAVRNRVIILNGPSSSGKSTLARELRDLIRRKHGALYEIVSIDDFLKMSPHAPIYEEDVFGISPALIEAASRALRTGCGVIIDHVITSQRILAQLTDAFSAYDPKLIRVSCPRDVLQAREAARGDRCPGSAEASDAYLFPKDGYDLTVNTQAASAAECAERIVEFIFHEGEDEIM